MTMTAEQDDTNPDLNEAKSNNHIDQEIDSLGSRLQFGIKSCHQVKQDEISIETLDSPPLILNVIISSRGFQLQNDNEIYETIESLLMARSPAFCNAFNDTLTRRLTELSKENN